MTTSVFVHRGIGLTIEHLPGRKQWSINRVTGQEANVYTPMAYFKEEADAKWTLDFILGLMKHKPGRSLDL